MVTGFVLFLFLKVSDIGDESLDFPESEEDGDQPSGKKDRNAKKTVAPIKIKINKKKKRRKGSDVSDVIII